jgi:hypothetical protein
MDSKIQFRDASPQLSVWVLSFDGEWWLLEPSQQLCWFAEADDYSDDTAAPTVDRPQLGRSHFRWHIGRFRTHTCRSGQAFGPY